MNQTSTSWSQTAKITPHSKMLTEHGCETWVEHVHLVDKAAENTSHLFLSQLTPLNYHILLLVILFTERLKLASSSFPMSVSVPCMHSTFWTRSCTFFASQTFETPALRAETTRWGLKHVILMGGLLPSSVYLGKHRCHSHDEMDQVFPLCFFILQAIKY